MLAAENSRHRSDNHFARTRGAGPCALWRGLAALTLLLTSIAVTAADLNCPLVEVFTRDGCPHCADAKIFLGNLQLRYPRLEIRYHEVSGDQAALERLLSLSERHGVSRPGVPSFLVCDAFYAGFAEAAGSGDWIEAQVSGRSAQQDYRIETPFGIYSLQQLGLPLFTVVIGLIDGFNPCAMWVLLFLLSILVNIRDRRRIVLIAGTFVLVSGLVYFAFMAAWLNLFLLIGFARWLQIGMALLALAIGAVHIKDFFAWGQGFSLSISDRARPGLYARVRAVLHAQNLGAALVGVILVAILVNLIELLCTAGLPALYTQLLTLNELPLASYYVYLGLYNLAYVFDDALMVAAAVFTLQKFKLQTRQGRWLKLISGSVVAILGLLLLAAPELLF